MNWESERALFIEWTTTAFRIPELGSGIETVQGNALGTARAFIFFGQFVKKFLKILYVFLKQF